MNHNTKIKWLYKISKAYFIYFLFCIVTINFAYAANTLDKIDFSSMPGDKLQIKMQFNNKAPNPTIFTIDNPARLVLDFKNLSINDAEANQKIDVGNVSTIKAVE
ncbi:MAG: AMIN domain-containing protein, partial [Gammaproteobacteria bacterium]|nr:AMIN domain-containing protein [Gammaproteobacteria bacterium]